MDGSQGSSNAPPPFLTKTYEMVDDPMTNSMVCWSETGYSFIGFRKIDPDQWEFANEEFIRGQKQLLKNIHRRKPIHSHSLNHQANSSVPLTGIEKKEFEEEIKRLSHDKSRLQLQLQRHQKENQEFQFQISLLSERFQNMEDQQRQAMDFMAQLIHQPHFLKEHHIWTSQNANLGAPFAPVLNLKQIEELESSIKCWEALFYGIGETMGTEVCDFGISSRLSPIVVTEMQTSSGDYDIDGELCSPSSHPCSPYSTDISSSPELAVSVYHADSPPIPSFHHTVKLKPKSSGICVNSKHAIAPQTDQALQKKEEAAATDHALSGKVIDVFWEQFLTEVPNSSDA
ncbi:hypothetical protein CRYUN_Cryun22dG0042800 [Craigia yunnanensis]